MYPLYKAYKIDFEAPHINFVRNALTDACDRNVIQIFANFESGFRVFLRRKVVTDILDISIFLICKWCACFLFTVCKNRLCQQVRDFRTHAGQHSVLHALGIVNRNGWCFIFSVAH